MNIPDEICHRIAQYINVPKINISIVPDISQGYKRKYDLKITKNSFIYEENKYYPIKLEYYKYIEHDFTLGIYYGYMCYINDFINGIKRNEKQVLSYMGDYSSYGTYYKTVTYDNGYICIYKQGKLINKIFFEKESMIKLLEDFIETLHRNKNIPVVIKTCL